VLPFEKNGYYTVNGQIYSNKINALFAGTQSNTHPEWVFNDRVFDKTLWNVEPIADITTLYQRRAKELRERYDYIILMYSAGVDSHNVLNSFISQGLKVDELVISWPVELSKKYSNDISDRSAKNYISEWTYLIDPQIKWISVYYPFIKITVIDSSTDIASNSYAEADFFEFENYYGIASMNRWPKFSKKLKQICSEHTNSVVLNGLDKPQLSHKDQNLYMFFVDTLIQLKSSDDLTVEYFYWSPDATDILRKQGHLIYQYFLQNKQLIPLLNNRNDQLLQIINQTIYPIFDPKRFQTRKQRYVLHNEQYSFLNDLADHDTQRVMDKWSSQWNNFNLAIDRKYRRYVDGLFDGFVGFVTPQYYIGNFK
jgi:hypothetical protein